MNQVFAWDLWRTSTHVLRVAFIIEPRIEQIEMLLFEKKYASFPRQEKNYVNNKCNKRNFNFYFFHEVAVVKSDLGKKSFMPRVRIELTTFRFRTGLWDWRAAYCANEASWKLKSEIYLINTLNSSAWPLYGVYKVYWAFFSPLLENAFKNTKILAFLSPSPFSKSLFPGSTLFHPVEGWESPGNELEQQGARVPTKHMHRNKKNNQ